MKSNLYAYVQLYWETSLQVSVGWMWIGCCLPFLCWKNETKCPRIMLLQPIRATSGVDLSQFLRDLSLGISQRPGTSSLEFPRWGLWSSNPGSTGWGKWGPINGDIVFGHWTVCHGIWPFNTIYRSFAYQTWWFWSIGPLDSIGPLC